MSRSLRLLVPVLAGVVLSACGGDDNSSTETTLTIPFAARAGAVDIACGAVLPALGTTGLSGSIADFAFYLHDVAVLDRNGKSYPVTLDANDFQDAAGGVALLDFQGKTDSCQGADKPVNHEVTGTVSGVKVANITGLSFRVGVPEALNHHDASLSQPPYNRSGLFWRWQSGHKFMRLDVNPVGKVQLAYDSNGSTESNSWFFHLGSTGCEGDPATGAVVSCANGNRPAVQFSSGFSVNNLTGTTVVLDYARLVQGANLGQDAVAPAGCMSGLPDVECVTLFSSLGLPFGTAATAAQSAFYLAQ
ncbi:MAG: metallo-mystery pair system four-Cys motif protein [Thiothrix sp.]|nr:metallo-mystery pair system four-Cys motif protein [Thiothrix sp.]HPE62396.1 metallo-mystery pair system four-Cys motif protein [Thiolinea sp.]